MKSSFFSIGCLVVLVLLTSVANSTDSSYNLFFIGRSRDENIIKYDINLTAGGKIIKEKPLKIYWVKYTDQNKVEELSFIQNKFAYGLDYLSVSENEVKFQFVSYDKMTFTIKKNAHGNFRVTTLLHNISVEVKRIHIQIDGGTFMLPKISYVQLFWKELNKNKENMEVIKP
jgi:hypothetical protein